MRSRHAVVLALALLAGCAQRLPVEKLPAFASYDAWCGQLKGATCKGEWAGGKGETTVLGAHRFVEIEAAATADFGGGPSVLLEFKTEHGLVYQPLGAIGSTGRSGSTTLNIEGVWVHGSVLDVRTHSRTTSNSGISDSQEASFLVVGSAGVGVVRVHLGTNSRDDLGRAKGSFGSLSWNGGTLESKGTRLKDGSYRLATP